VAKAGAPTSARAREASAGAVRRRATEERSSKRRRPKAAPRLILCGVVCLPRASGTFTTLILRRNARLSYTAPRTAAQVAGRVPRSSMRRAS
jgi:hypothetical protein